MTSYERFKKQIIDFTVIYLISATFTLIFYLLDKEKIIFKFFIFQTIAIILIMFFSYFENCILLPSDIKIKKIAYTIKYMFLWSNLIITIILIFLYIFFDIKLLLIAIGILLLLSSVLIISVIVKKEKILLYYEL